MKKHRQTVDEESIEVEVDEGSVVSLTYENSADGEYGGLWTMERFTLSFDRGEYPWPGWEQCWEDVAEILTAGQAGVESTLPWTTEMVYMPDLAWLEWDADQHPPGHSYEGKLGVTEDEFDRQWKEG